ncbi:lamin tail domain-containing protein [Candidatus Gracilibacteria bacterium]|nr:lamin tail domain-containing protein [Candidatus Gracilibacteria bacterium]
MFYRVLAVVVLSLLIGPFMPFAVRAQSDERCFPETGFCIRGPIRAYWEANGGLAVFGYPITVQTEELVEGSSLQVQWFERDRLEIQADATVTAGRLGVERLEQLGTPWQMGPNSPAGPACTAFPATGHQLCGAFAAYWNANGGLERFGYPVTNEFETVLEGQSYRVQYFERRRFELHPEIAPDAVLLGLLGREVLNGRSTVEPAPTPQPQPAPQPQPTPTPQPPPPSYNECREDPNAAQAPNFPVDIVAINDSTEVVTLKNVSAEAVSLDGWIMCSVKGNQRHDGISGALAPGEQRDFNYTGPGTIWNNSEPDPGALYNPQGQLISYWAD